MVVGRSAGTSGSPDTHGGRYVGSVLSLRGLGEQSTARGPTATHTFVAATLGAGPQGITCAAYTVGHHWLLYLLLARFWQSHFFCIGAEQLGKSNRLALDRHY